MPNESSPLIYVDLIEEEPLSEAGYAQAKGMTVDELGEAHQRYLDAFQPWRIMILSGDNQARLFRSTERYFNEADARHAAELAFGAGSNVYLRQKEHGNVLLRLAMS